MKINVKSSVEKDVHYLRAQCSVRYWEDATVNGQTEDNDAPTIPFSEGEQWCPLIALDTGVIQGWPEGTVAEVHYKVCDDGRYTLLDADMRPVFSTEGYVPSIMCPGGAGYGDYVIMKIGPDGKIANWFADLSDFSSEASE